MKVWAVKTQAGDWCFFTASEDASVYSRHCGQDPPTEAQLVGDIILVLATGSPILLDGAK